MQQNIEVKFLTPKEMENARSIDWRYEHVDGNNLGFADKQKNRIFVRAGLDAELTKYLIDHELSHLFELEGTDEDEHGIRHKNFAKALLASINPFNLFSSPGTHEPNLYPGQHNPDWTAPITAFAPGIGAVMGGPIGAAVGDFTGKALTGHGFGESAKSGIQTGITSGVGDFVSEGLGMGNIVGQAAGSATGASLGSMFGRPSPGFNSGNLFGFGPSSSVPIPNNMNTNMQGSESLTNSRGMGSLSKMPLNPGLGQAGLNLEGKSMSAGFGDNMNRMFGMEQNPLDLSGNFSNISF